MPTLRFSESCQSSSFLEKFRLPSIKSAGLVMALSAVALLGGCANYNSTKPGMPVSEVLQKLGKPTTICRNDNGTERLIWSLQPFGQFAWGTDTTPQGTIVGMKQLLTDEHFAVLATGQWSDKRVLCEFGEPANKYGISKGHEIVWAYRYKESGVWPSMMYVYMGADGKQANRFHPGPDPDTLGDGDNRR